MPKPKPGSFPPIHNPPITDDPSATANGYMLGLYGGTNDPSPALASAATAAGAALTNPKVAVIGMSNTRVIADALAPHYNGPYVNCADNSAGAERWAGGQQSMSCAANADVIIQMHARPVGNLFPTLSSYVDALTTDLGTIARRIRDETTAKLILTFTRMWSCDFNPRSLNPEPYAWGTGIAVQRLLNGHPFAGNLTGVPPNVWVGYSWADGSTPRAPYTHHNYSAPGGLTWSTSDLQADCTHPSPAGAAKIAAMINAELLVQPWSTWWQ